MERPLLSLTRLNPEVARINQFLRPRGRDIRPTLTHLAATYNVLFMIMMSWMSSLWRWVLFLPGLWPTNAGYCFVSARKRDNPEVSSNDVCNGSTSSEKN